MKSDLAFQRRQLMWSGVVVFGALLAYGGFLASIPNLLLCLPLVLGLALLPIWFISLIDNSQRLQEKELEGEHLQKGNKIFEDDYEVVLLKRQMSITRGPLRKGVFIWGSLVSIYAAYLLWSFNHHIQVLENRSLAPAAFNAFLGIIFFVTGRYLIGVSKEFSGARLSTTIASWLVYSSFILFPFSLGIFLIGSDLSFTIPFILGLSVLFLIGLLLEWPLRSISSYYGSEKPTFPPYCPILPLLQWKAQPNQGFQKDLEYQFGYDLSSGTKAILWKMAFPAFVFLCFILLLGSSLIIVPQGHQGIKLTWGQPDLNTLAPGLHFHSPWPIGTHRLVDTGTLQRLHIEKNHQEGGDLWGSPSHNDDLLMVVRSPANKKEGWPIEVLAVNAEIGFQWNKPHQVIFGHSNPSEAIRQKALELLTEKMRLVPINEWWSTSRSSIEKNLVSNLQEWADQYQIGARIAFFSLAQLHPPQETGEAYDETSKARFDRDAKIIKAQGEIARLEASLNDEVARRLTVASSQGNILIHQAEARLKGLQGISKAASIDPDLFWDRRRLQTLAELSSDLRKILILRDGNTQVQELDLESHLDVESFDLKLKSRKLRR